MKSSTVPVIILTSKDDELDQVIGLRLGAEDYITKPFSQRLLIERIRSVLRRYAATIPVKQGDIHDQSYLITRGSLELDDSRHLCKWKGETVNLTVTEYLLIKTLAISRTCKVPRPAYHRRLWRKHLCGRSYHTYPYQTDSPENA